MANPKSDQLVEIAALVEICYLAGWRGAVLAIVFEREVSVDLALWELPF